jgi:cell division protein FtsZ
VIVIPNDRLTGVVERRTTLEETFRIADDVLRQGVQGIAGLILHPGVINLDLADVRAVMTGAGEALMGIGFGAGESRAEDAARQAVASPLLESSIDGARGILLNVTAGPDVDLGECETAAGIVRAVADPDANVIFGVVTDTRMRSEMRITLVATGFRRRQPPGGEPPWPSGIPSRPRPRTDGEGATAWPGLELFEPGGDQR